MADIFGDMKNERYIEEAHGLWELSAQRVCAISELLWHYDGAAAYLILQRLKAASLDERAAFSHWQKISNEVTRG